VLTSGVVIPGIEVINRKGRPYLQWLDDIKDWCQKDIQFLIRIAEERSKRRHVVKCSWGFCPLIMMVMMAIRCGG